MIEHASHLSLYPVEKFKELDAARICLQNELTSVKDKLQKVWPLSLIRIRPKVCIRIQAVS